MLKKQLKRLRRIKRIRARVKGTRAIPRLSVFKSAKHIYAFLIDDEKGKTLLLASDFELKKKPKGKTKIAFAVGELLANKAKEKKFSKIVFDRHGYKYTGRIKALADGAREKGLLF